MFLDFANFGSTPSADNPKEVSMAKGSRSAGGRSTASRGSSGTSAGSSATRSTNSRMWSQPATARQIAALNSTGNFDGKYYSKGRAGQTIGQSVRPATAARARLPAQVAPRSTPSLTKCLNT